MPMPLFALSAVLRDTFTGYWSPYALLLMIVMAFTGLIILVLFIIFAMMGRLFPRPGENPPGDTPEAETEFTDILGEDDQPLPVERTPTRSEKAALRKAEQNAGTWPRERPKTGWQYLLFAIGCSVVSPLAFFWMDNPYGRMRVFTFGTLVTMLLLAAQVFFLVRFALLQRKLRP